MTFQDLLVSSYQQSGTGDGAEPLDTFSLDFSTIELDYTPQRADGSRDTSITAGYDLKANKKI